MEPWKIPSDATLLGGAGYRFHFRFPPTVTKDVLWAPCELSFSSLRSRRNVLHQPERAPLFILMTYDYGTINGISVTISSRL